MTCAPPHERVISRRHKLTAAAPLDPVEIDGTWDFKWRKGAKIRVAFQSPAAGDEGAKLHSEIVERVIDIAGRWRTSIRSDSRAEGASKAGEVPLELHFLTSQPVDPSFAQGVDAPKVTLAEAVRYDVLISLAKLPVIIAEGAGRPEQRVLLPRSELGRYARRLEYGVPTAFLGPFRPDQSLEAFYGTEEWEHIVLHELGHVLGLVHPHQQHNANVNWKSDAELKSALPRLLGVKIPEAQLEHYIDWQIRAPLPQAGPEGAVFSDEWTVPIPHSVMNPPFLSQVADVAGTLSRPGLLVEPTEADLAHLRSMYPDPQPSRRSTKQSKKA